MESWPAFEGIKPNVTIFAVMVDDPSTPVRIGMQSYGGDTEPYHTGWDTSIPVDFVVLWGDGIQQDYRAQNMSQIRHTYENAGKYTVVVIGWPNDVDGTVFRTNSWGVNSCLVSINSPLPGPLALTPSSGYFYNFKHLEYIDKNTFSWFAKHKDDYVWDADGRNFEYFFANCISLKSVPGELFDGIDEIMDLTSIEGFFKGCTSLESVGRGLFSGEVFQAVKSVASLFEGCTSLKTYPDGFFDRFVEANFSNCFRGSGITHIRPNTFKHCNQTLRLFRAFRECKSLLVLSEDDFMGLDSATNFEECFMESGIQRINGNIFRNCPNAQNFRNCFYHCESLVYVSDDIFDGITTPNPDFSGAFANCYNLGHCPPLWERWPRGSAGHCFANCTNADNYNLIPSIWK